MGTITKQGYFGTPPIVTNGLVLHLDAGSRQSYVSGSTTWIDLSGNGNSGSLVNEPTFNSTNQGSIVFDGSNDYVNLGQRFEFISSNPFSLCAWVRTSYNLSSPQTIIGKASMTDPFTGYQFGFNTVTGNNNDIGKIGFNIVFANPVGGLGINPIRILTPSTYNDNNWKYVVATYNGQQDVRGMFIFVNGTPVVTTTTDSFYTPSYVLTNSANFEIGARDGTQQPFNGSIAQAQVYNRALSPAEVAQNYNALKNRYGLT